MNLLDIATLFIFPTLMAFAGLSDLMTMTISNRVSMILVVAFVIIALAVGVPLETIGWHLTCGLGVLAITFTLFAVGSIGGGDAKLAAATAVWLGWGEMMNYGLTASLVGGALTVAFIQLRAYPMHEALLARAWFARLFNVTKGVPYGIALAIAGVMVYPDTPVWVAALSR